MIRFSKKMACLLAITISQLHGIAPAWAQEYPSKLIKIVVANSPGTTQDIIARSMGPELAKILGQPIVVENKVGAQQMVGMEYLAKQVPNDGYTLGVASPTILAVAPLVVKDLRFDPLKDVPPFIGISSIRLFLLSPAQAPWKNFSEMVAYAKANPGKLNFGTASPPVRLAMETVLRSQGLNLVHIPYKATGPIMLGILANEIQLNISAIGDALAPGDRVRLLAVTGDQRYPPLPDVPTFRELGIQVQGATYTLNAPAGTPKSVIDKLYAASTRVLQLPHIQAQFAGMRMDVTGDPPEMAAKGLAEEARTLSEIAKQIGLRPE